MATTVQVTFDCADPHRLARFWAEAVHYELEDHSPVVDEAVAAGHLPPEAVEEVDGRRYFAGVDACADPDEVGPRLFFQRVPEGKAVKNRVHLDLRVPEEGRDAEVQRLVGLGATHLGQGSLPGMSWELMADPEGNEFDLD